METLQILKQNAMKAFKSADQKGKALLTDLFGDKTFNEKITDRIKTFEDACEVLGLDIEYKVTIEQDENNDDKSIRAYFKLIMIIRALNEGWIPNWHNSNETKYYPWFEMKTSGFGFTFTNCGYAHTAVGSRLCFKTRELAEYAAKQFAPIYKDYFTL